MGFDENAAAAKKVYMNGWNDALAFILTKVRNDTNKSGIEFIINEAMKK